jgi:hypothetical protein
MGEETVAEKFWPVEEILEPIDSSKTTVILESAGTTRRLDAKFSGEGFAEPLGESFDALSGVADGLLDFWQPETAMDIAANKNTPRNKELSRLKEYLPHQMGRLPSIVSLIRAMGKGFRKCWGLAMGLPGNENVLSRAIIRSGSNRGPLEQNRSPDPD